MTPNFFSGREPLTIEPLSRGAVGMCTISHDNNSNNNKTNNNNNNTDNNNTDNNHVRFIVLSVEYSSK